MPSKIAWTPSASTVIMPLVLLCSTYFIVAILLIGVSATASSFSVTACERGSSITLLSVMLSSPSLFIFNSDTSWLVAATGLGATSIWLDC